MRRRIFLTIYAIVLFSGMCNGQTVDNSPVVGVWRAQMGDLPVFTMVITDEGGGLSGAIVFYMVRRDSPDQKPTATPGNPEPLLHPRFDGKTLTFEISHRRAHPPGTLNDPPVTMSFKPLAPGNAEILNMSDNQSFTVTRSDY